MTSPADYTAGNSELPEALAVSVDTACSLTSLTRSSLYREIRAGRISIRKAGSRTLVPMAAIRDWLQSLPRSKAA